VDINIKIISILFALIFFVGCAREPIPTKIVILRNSIIALDTENRTLWKMTEGDSAIESFAKSLKVLDSLSSKNILIVPHYINTVSPDVPAAGLQGYLDFLYYVDIKKGKVKWRYQLEGLYKIVGGSKIISEDVIKIIPVKDNFLIFTTMRVLEISKNGKLIFWNNYSKGEKDIGDLIDAIIRDVKKLDENKFLLLGTDCFGIYNKDNRKIELTKEENRHNLAPVYANGKIYWLRETVNKALTSYFSLCQYSTDGKLLKTLNKDFLENVYEQKSLLWGEKLYLLVNSNRLLVVDTHTDSVITGITSDVLLDTVFLYGGKVYCCRFSEGEVFSIQDGRIARYEKDKSFIDRTNGMIHILNPHTMLYINRERNVVITLDGHFNNIGEERKSFLGVDKEYWAIQESGKIGVYRGLKKWLSI